MVPQNYNYTEKGFDEIFARTCANCENRAIAFHLVSGTSFCTVHNARTNSSKYFTCSSWKDAEGKRPIWTQEIRLVFEMPEMYEVKEIKQISTRGFCTSCKYANTASGVGLYCVKYFDELEGTDRTCKMCQVGLFGNCDFYEHDDDQIEKEEPPVTEKVVLKVR